MLRRRRHDDRDGVGRVKRHRLLLLLDEFPTLRKMEFVSESLRQMAGYGIKALIVAQSFQDIEEYYGPKQTIVDNCHVLTCFAAADTGTAQRISQMTGTSTEYRKSFGRSGRLDPTRSVNYSEQTRPLLGVGDVRELPYDEQLLFVTGHPPLRCRKVTYWNDSHFKNRLLPAPTGNRKHLDLPPTSSSMWAGVRAAQPAPPLEDESEEDLLAHDNRPKRRKRRAVRRVVQATSTPREDIFPSAEEEAGDLDRMNGFGDTMNEAVGPEPSADDGAFGI